MASVDYLGVVTCEARIRIGIHTEAYARKRTRVELVRGSNPFKDRHPSGKLIQNNLLTTSQ